MGIEPTRDCFKPHTGFEDQGRQPGRRPPPYHPETSFANRQKALDESGNRERALISHGTENLNIISRFVSNGELTVLADALAAHGKTLTDAGRFYLEHLNTEQENRRSRPVTTVLQLVHQTRVHGIQSRQGHRDPCGRP